MSKGKAGKPPFGQPGKVWFYDDKELVEAYGGGAGGMQALMDEYSRYLSRQIDKDLMELITGGMLKDPPKPQPKDRPRMTFEQCYQLELSEREEELDNDAIAATRA